MKVFIKVGWKFTSLAGQKAAELSENVTEKVGRTHVQACKKTQKPGV